MAQLVTDDFPLAASVWSGDKFLMEAATSGGSKRMKVTAEVVGAYLSGSGSGTIIAPESIPIEDIDALTDTKDEMSAKGGNNIAVQSTPTVNNNKINTNNTGTAIKSVAKQLVSVEKKANKTANITDLAKRAAIIEDLTIRTAKITEIKRSAKVEEITRKAVISDGTPRARVIYVG